MKKRLFISHISEEREVAESNKGALDRDFLGLLEVLSRRTQRASRLGKSGCIQLRELSVIAQFL